MNTDAENRTFVKFSSSLLASLSMILYKFTFDYIYVNIISPRYAYMGFVADFNIYRYATSLMLFAVMLLPLIKLFQRKRSSSIIVFIVSLIYFVPGLTYYSFGGLNNDFFVFYAAYWIMLVLLQMVMNKIKFRNLELIKSEFLFNSIVMSLAIITIALSGVYTGFRLSIDLSQVYNWRFEVRELNMPSIAHYLLSASYVILPLGTVYFFTQKRKFAAFALIFAQLLIFSFNGKKSVLVMLIVTLLILMFFSEKRFNLLVVSFPLLNLFAILESLLRGGSSEIAKYIHRRVMLIPTDVSSRYFDFFSENELLYLRGSILRWFGFESPYPMTVSRMIGYLYSGNIDQNANTGLIGDAFANFGWFGFIVYPVLIIAFLHLFDQCSRGIDMRVIAVLWILVAYKFMSSPFFTALLTGGLILTCVALYLYPRQTGNMEMRERQIQTR